MLAERLAPAAAALASAFAEDISAGAAAHLPEPARAPAEEPANDLDDWTPEPEPRTGIIDRRTKKLHAFRAARPGRAEAKQTQKTVTHVSGL